MKNYGPLLLLVSKIQIYLDPQRSFLVTYASYKYVQKLICCQLIRDWSILFSTSFRSNLLYMINLANIVYISHMIYKLLHEVRFTLCTSSNCRFLITKINKIKDSSHIYKKKSLHIHCTTVKHEESKVGEPMFELTQPQ